MANNESFFARAESLIERLERLLPASGEHFDPGPHHAWRWRKKNSQGYLQPITRFNDISLADLQHIDHQASEMDRNTRQFLAGLPANNALLWGPRGTGKSSLVKAIFNRYRAEGLRLVEVERHDLIDLPEIVDQLDGVDARFVIFCDDLSFDANDPIYRALKVVLDGSILATPDNIVVYATSNRRHLVPESQSDNQDAQMIDGEIHQSEAVEEKISLSERFGLWLSFHPFRQDDYLDIARHWLRALEVEDPEGEAVTHAALQWALLHGSRSGRTAYHFAKDWAGQTQLKS